MVKSLDGLNISQWRGALTLVSLEDLKSFGITRGANIPLHCMKNGNELCSFGVLWLFTWSRSISLYITEPISVQCLMPPGNTERESTGINWVKKLLLKLILKNIIELLLHLALSSCPKKGFLSSLWQFFFLSNFLRF